VPASFHRRASLLSFPQFDIIDLAGATVDRLEIDLGLLGHVDVLAFEHMLLAVDAQHDRALLQFERDVMPLVEAE
jgi:hypothetical protein